MAYFFLGSDLWLIHSDFWILAEFAFYQLGMIHLFFQFTLWFPLKCSERTYFEFHPHNRPIISPIECIFSLTEPFFSHKVFFPFSTIRNRTTEISLKSLNGNNVIYWMSIVSLDFDSNRRSIRLDNWIKCKQMKNHFNWYSYWEWKKMKWFFFLIQLFLSIGKMKRKK